METGKGRYEKTASIQTGSIGVSAMAAFDSLPGSGHSAVALETAQESPEGDGLSTRSAKWKRIQGQPEWEALGADLYSVMISWYLHRIRTNKLRPRFDQ